MLSTAIGMAVVMPSCVQDNGECITPEDVQKDGFQIRFQIVTRGNSGSRATLDYIGEQAGTVYENFLNIDDNDIKYYLFDKDKKFLCDLTPNAETTVANDMYTLYDVVAKVDDEYFKSNINGTLDFYIMALANHSGWGVTLPKLERGDDVNALFNNGITMSTMPDADKLILAADDGATAGQKQYFPMAGIQNFRIAGSMLLTTWQGMPYDISLATGRDLNMLRALAKLEVADKLHLADAGKNEDPLADGGEITVTDIDFRGFMSRGSLVPRLEHWEKAGSWLQTQQVDATSVFEQYGYREPPVLKDDYTVEAINPELPNCIMPMHKSVDKDGCDVYTAYVYEFSTNYLGTKQRPYFMVHLTETVKNEDGTTATRQSEYPVKLAVYENGHAKEYLDALMRNYIYRFELGSIQRELTVDWTVCPMDEASANITFN